MSDHSRRYTAEHWDHQRDLRKAEWRPGDEPPLSVQANLSDAIETVAAIKRVDIDLAVQLLDAYYNARRSEERLEAVAAGSNS